jgi:hypothetical protein
MRDLRRHIDRVGPALQRIEEIGKALPFPGQALSKHDTGDFLDPLHQLHQRRTVLRPDWGKTHPQLPNSVVVTPCQHEGASRGSHIACPS